METKRCSKCQVTKPIEEFYKNKATKNGYSSWCKECCNKVTIKWRKEHPEQRKEAQRKHRAKHPEYAKKWRKEHIEQDKEAQRKYQVEHPEYYKTYFQTENGKAVKARSQFKRKTTFKNTVNNLTSLQWQEIKKSQNYTCLHCGRSEPEITLTRDHIIPVAFGGHNTASNIQGLCLSCNSKKRTKIDSIGFSKLLTENKILV